MVTDGLKKMAENIWWFLMALNDQICFLLDEYMKNPDDSHMYKVQKILYFMKESAVLDMIQEHLLNLWLVLLEELKIELRQEIQILIISNATK